MVSFYYLSFALGTSSCGFILLFVKIKTQENVVSFYYLSFALGTRECGFILLFVICYLSFALGFALIHPLNLNFHSGFT